MGINFLYKLYKDSLIILIKDDKNYLYKL